MLAAIYSYMGHRKKNAGKDYLMVKIPAWLPPVESIAGDADLITDRLRIVINQFFLCWLHANKSPNKKKMHILGNGYFPVSSAILREVATDRYIEYVDLLIQLGVIERKANYEGGRNYSPGFHSQLYRFLLPDIKGASLKFRDEKVTDYRTIKSVLKKRDRYVLDDKEHIGKLKLLPVHQTLKQYVLDTTIDMELAAAIEREHNPDFATDAYSELDMLHLEAVCRGDVGFFCVDSFGERFHHHILNLNKRFRPAIRFNGFEQTPLVSIDIACSQNYFCSMLPLFFDRLLHDFEPLRSLINELSKQPDYIYYRYLCETGKFNTYLGLMRDIDPNIAKVEFFKAVIFAKRKIGPADVMMRNEFRRFFPGVYKFFMAVKRLDETDLPALKDIIVETRGKYRVSNNSHKILPSLLQRLESRVVQILCEKIIAQGDEGQGLAPILSIHDAFLVLPEHVDRTVDLINATFGELGVNPPVLVVKNLAEN